MTKRTQQIIIRQDGPFARLTVHIEARTPSWRRYGPGTATASFNIHAQAEWVEVRLEEFGHDPDVRRETMLTLDPTAARALRDFLAENLAPKAAGNVS